MPSSVGSGATARTRQLYRASAPRRTLCTRIESGPRSRMQLTWWRKSDQCAAIPCRFMRSASNGGCRTHLARRNRFRECSGTMVLYHLATCWPLAAIGPDPTICATTGAAPPCKGFAFVTVVKREQYGEYRNAIQRFSCKDSSRRIAADGLLRRLPKSSGPEPAGLSKPVGNCIRMAIFLPKWKRLFVQLSWVGRSEQRHKTGHLFGSYPFEQHPTRRWCLL
jgi:hypothetical protein